MDDRSTVTTEIRDHLVLIGLDRPEKRNAFSLRMLRELSLRLRAADQNIENLALGTVFDRLFHFLGHLGRRFPVVDERAVITKRPTHQELAEIIGASRETVTRCLTEMESLGLIEIRKREIVVLPAFFKEEAARSL